MKLGAVAWGLIGASPSGSSQVPRRRGVEIDVPIGVFVGEEESAVFESHKEKLDRAYLFWTPTNRISLSGQVVYDTFESRAGHLDQLFCCAREAEGHSASPSGRDTSIRAAFSLVLWSLISTRRLCVLPKRNLSALQMAGTLSL